MRKHCWQLHATCEHKKAFIIIFYFGIIKLFTLYSAKCNEKFDAYVVHINIYIKALQDLSSA